MSNLHTNIVVDKLKNKKISTEKIEYAKVELHISKESRAWNKRALFKNATKKLNGKINELKRATFDLGKSR